MKEPKAMNKDWKKTHTIYWKDEINDDFDSTITKRPGVDKDYQYVYKNKSHWFITNFLYYGIVKPILGTWCYFHGIRTRNKKNLKLVKDTGAVIYANHVALADCIKYPCICKNKVDVIGYSDALTIPVIGKHLRGLGFLPLPNKEDKHNFQKMMEAIKYLLKERHHFLLIFPEAHIWPYYTEIRNYKDNAFIYPSLFNVPVVPIVTTWKKRWLRKKPRQLVIFGNPIYPKENNSIAENKAYLREECYKQMIAMAHSYEQQQYIQYIKEDN